MGFSTAAYVAMAAAGGMAASSLLAPKPSAPNVPAPPQASQAPDVAGTVKGMAGAGQGGGAPGVAQTFLTGSGGVDPSLLQLGKNTLLGGGAGSGPTGMGSMS